LVCDRLAIVLPQAFGRAEERDPTGVAFWFHAEGNVRLQLLRRDLILQADAVFFERYRDGTQTVLLEGVRLRTTIENVRSLATAVELRDVRGTMPFGEPLERGRGVDTVPFTLAAG